jgi:hypothetical protein
MDYTKLSLAEVRAALEGITLETEATFGSLDARQLNWRPDATRWSVAQCFEHLLLSNGLMFTAAKEAMNPTQPRTLWQRAPVLPGVFGRMLIRSQAPGSTRKFTASPNAQPTASEVAADIVRRFGDQHRATLDWLAGLDERDAGRAIMTSPFVRLICYSVLDGCRLVVAHDRRHVEQADRVTREPGFPGTLPMGSGVHDR